MSSCARCCVRDSMARHGAANVVEIVGQPESSGWIPYKIYTSDTRNRRSSDKPYFSFDGRDWYWIMTVFSENHSLDEDCSSLKNPSRFGFPVRLSELDVQWYL